MRESYKLSIKENKEAICYQWFKAINTLEAYHKGWYYYRGATEERACKVCELKIKCGLQ